MRSAGEETDRSTFTLTALYRMLDHAYTDLFTCKEPHGDTGQSTRNAALDPLERADHLAVHGAAAEPGPVHAADEARSRDLGGGFRFHHAAAGTRPGSVGTPCPADHPPGARGAQTACCEQSQRG